MKVPLIILLFISCTTHNNNRTVNLPEVGWSFELPSDVTFKDSSFNKNGEITNSLWETSSFSSKPRVELFWIETDKNNYFNTILFIDTSDYASWEKNNIEDSKFYLDGISHSTDFKLVDSIMSFHKIDNIVFRKEYFKVYNVAKGDTFYSYKFSRKYHNYDVNINIRFTEPKTGNKYLDILRNSKFKE